MYHTLADVRGTDEPFRKRFRSADQVPLPVEYAVSRANQTPVTQIQFSSTGIPDCSALTSHFPNGHIPDTHMNTFSPPTVAHQYRQCHGVPSPFSYACYYNGTVAPCGTFVQQTCYPGYFEQDVAESKNSRTPSLTHLPPTPPCTPPTPSPESLEDLPEKVLVKIFQSSCFSPEDRVRLQLVSRKIRSALMGAWPGVRRLRFAVTEDEDDRQKYVSVRSIGRSANVLAFLSSAYSCVYFSVVVSWSRCWCVAVVFVRSRWL